MKSKTRGFMSLSCWPRGFRENFYKDFYEPMEENKPHGVVSLGSLGHGWQVLRRGTLSIATY